MDGIPFGVFVKREAWGGAMKKQEWVKPFLGVFWGVALVGGGGFLGWGVVLFFGLAFFFFPWFWGLFLVFGGVLGCFVVAVFAFL